MGFPRTAPTQRNSAIHIVPDSYGIIRRKKLSVDHGSRGVVCPYSGLNLLLPILLVKGSSTA
jgi:hypothetical protein